MYVSDCEGNSSGPISKRNLVRKVVWTKLWVGMWERGAYRESGRRKRSQNRGRKEKEMVFGRDVWKCTDFLSHVTYVFYFVTVVGNKLKGLITNWLRRESKKIQHEGYGEMRREGRDKRNACELVEGGEREGERRRGI